MKKIFVIFMILFVGLGIFAGCSKVSSGVVRIHIRANSNSECDQSVKLVVRDAVVEYITPLIAECSDSNAVLGILENNLDNIEMVANEVLLVSNFNYVSHAKITNEYFPTREYGTHVFPADYYDALIINLGSGAGNNWWCVAYPPLCFIGNAEVDGQVRYKSKLIELINKYFGR